MEPLCPSLWNSVFDFISQLVFIRTFGKRLVDTLFVELVKFVIKLSNHVLDVLSLFLLIQFVNHSLFNVSFTERQASLRISQLRCQWFLLHDLVYCGVLVVLKQLNIAIIYIVNNLFVHALNLGQHKWTFWVFAMPNLHCVFIVLLSKTGIFLVALVTIAIEGLCSGSVLQRNWVFWLWKPLIGIFVCSRLDVLFSRNLLLPRVEHVLINIYGRQFLIKQVLSFRNTAFSADNWVYWSSKNWHFYPVFY